MLYLLSILLVTYCILIFTRNYKYGYKTNKDYLYNLNNNKITDLNITYNTINLPDDISEYDTLFLKISLSLNPMSILFKPYIKIEETKHYFEYMAKGIRYLNISHVKNTKLELKLHHIIFSDEKSTLYGYKNHIKTDENILILAPHADDAEIASFGLYKKFKNITIVTTTIGENGACNYCDIYNNNKAKQTIKKAELRTFDALNIPLLGNINRENCLTLGYYGGSLQWMQKNQNSIYEPQVKINLNNYRHVTHSIINLAQYTEPTYKHFLNDLQIIIKNIKPSIIITAHPNIDSHSDHQQTTIAAIEALQELNMNAKLLLYTNHLQTSETYPIGPIGSSITLPPNFKDFYFDSIYSFELDKDLQLDKFFALEAMHDLRDSLVFVNIKRAYKHLSKMIRRKIAGKDKNYYKRAIRLNELFFVIDNKNITKL